MSTFAGTVEHYRRYRPGIPAAVTDVLTAAAPERRPRRLLDVGTGTGLVVEALLPHFDDILAIDTDSDMLAAAEAVLRPQVPGGTLMALRRCAAEEFTPPDDWRADLVTICRAFHWLDQAGVLRQLDDQVAPDGAVAIFGDNSFWAAGSPWKSAIREMIQDFLGKERRAGAGVFRHHDRPYSEIMQESAFNDVQEMRVAVHRVWSAESILGYLYSTSFAAPHLFGDRLPEFEAAVRHTLARFSDDDTFDENNEFLIRIGRRSQQ
ncbi:class I SAM-dependent methyltransferase [Plantactinospora sonchi]|uniref:Methyltransferase domain-containing protein n=1 Tax=Plantactinospora sonchi TaxID=1544735 RepID=A0ABU7RVC5_9ACTN